MLCESSHRELEPRLELNLPREYALAERQPQAQLVQMDDQMVFGTVMTTRALCRCGAVAELDRSVLRTKRSLGKVVECRRCRNNRISREKEELDSDYFGNHEPVE